MGLRITTLCHFAECHVLFIIMLNIVMLNIVLLNIVMLSVIMLSIIMLSVIMLNVVMLSIVALLSSLEIGSNKTVHNLQRIFNIFQIFNDLIFVFFCFRHEGRKMKQELRCHAVLCPSENKARLMCKRLRERLHQVSTVVLFLCECAKLCNPYND